MDIKTEEMGDFQEEVEVVVEAQESIQRQEQARQHAAAKVAKVEMVWSS